MSSLRVHNGYVQGIACQVQTPCKFYKPGPMTTEGLKDSEVNVNAGDYIVCIGTKQEVYSRDAFKKLWTVDGEL